MKETELKSEERATGDGEGEESGGNEAVAAIRRLRGREGRGVCLEMNLNKNFRRICS